MLTSPVHTYTPIHTASEVRALVNDLIFAWQALPLDLFWWVDGLRRLPDETPINADVVSYVQAIHTQYRGAVVYVPESEEL